VEWEYIVYFEYHGKQRKLTHRTEIPLKVGSRLGDGVPGDTWRGPRLSVTEILVESTLSNAGEVKAEPWAALPSTPTAD
jgi:hypothetical protein